MNYKLTTPVFFYLLLGISQFGYAQTMFDNMEMPPSIIGNKGKVFIGQQKGVIYTNTSSLMPGTPIDSLVAGKELPEELATTQLLSMPDKKKSPNLIVGFVSYKVQNSKDRYGILRSTDLGSTWQLIKPDALNDTTDLAVKVNFFQIPIKKFHWLNDKVGYLYGVKGIWKTTDAGLTWEKIFKPSNSDYEVRALSFKDEMNGLAVMGLLYGNYFYTTTDGGKSWEYTDQYPSERSVLDLSYINNEFRCFSFYRAQSYYNTYMYFVNPATNRWAEYKASPISKEMTFMGEILWLGRLRGWIVMRAGEIWYTPDGGRNWEPAMLPDTAKYQGLWGDADKKPVFGQSSDLLDDSLIIQAVSLRKRVGTQNQTIGLYYSTRWAISSFSKESASAPDEPNINLFDNVSVSLNSASTELMVKFSGGISNVRLSNVLGGQLPVTSTEQNGVINYDISNLSSGLYFITWKEKGINKSKKFVVQR